LQRQPPDAVLAGTAPVLDLLQSFTLDRGTRKLDARIPCI
jgi:hypothetical protein